MKRTQPAFAGFEGGEKVHQPRNATDLETVEKAHKEDFPLEFPEGIQLTWHPDFGSMTLILVF